jgi:hypothetical protein
MLRNHKKLFISLGILLLLGIMGWFVFVQYSVKWLEGKLNVVFTDLRQKGYTISYSTLEITGNPFSVKAILQNPHLKDPQGLFEWEGPAVTIAMRPWKEFTLNCVFPGEQKISLLHTLLLPLGVFHFEGAKGIFSLTSQGRLVDITFTATRLSSFIGNQPQLLLLQDLSLSVYHLTDPLNLKLVLATNLLGFETLLSKASKAQPLTLNVEANLSGFPVNAPLPSSLAEWRDGGGVLDVVRFKLDWPPIIAEVEGTLTFDHDMYPLGSFSSKIIGYQEALTNMVTLGWVKKKNAMTASCMLELFSSSDENGAKQLVVPLTLQNRRVSVGPASLFKLKSFEGL